ncbi:glycosyltransferase [Seonamhaeicola sediminis]|uniref:glycosyltransferase n=1 Tax=Seonamhaeicola sediminis TaxID=2528206 RepID=UPI001648A90B|nr:glycosyltransferase [Seonamhaeicola sediminis]
MKNSIAVLLPHYNNCSGLRISLKSLQSEIQPFTLFVYDDGSNDFSYVERIISEFREFYDIRLKRNSKNLGITETLNRGLKHILECNTYEFIARLDAGDICVGSRFENQIRTFNIDKELGLVGSWVKFVDINRNKLFFFKPPSGYKELKRSMHSYNPFIHSSVMFRTDVVKAVGFYPTNYPALEDYAFFFKIIKKFKATVVEKTLVEYEYNPEGISIKRRGEQTKSRIKLLMNEYKFGLFTTIGLVRAFITFVLPFKLLLFFKKKFI